MLLLLSLGFSPFLRVFLHDWRCGAVALHLPDAAYVGILTAGANRSVQRRAAAFVPRILVHVAGTLDLGSLTCTSA